MRCRRRTRNTLAGMIHYNAMSVFPNEPAHDPPMTPDPLNSILVFAAMAFGFLGVVLLLSSIAALRRSRPLRSALRTLTGLLMLALAALSGTVAVGLQGYQALTREEIAATLNVRPLGRQSFEAKVRFPDGREQVYELNGDEVYVDAHILKWHPRLNLLGLHTAYELGRIGGRYHGIDQEREAPRTVYLLGQDKPVDLFGASRRHAFLSPLVDAQYGSATFVPVGGPEQFEVRVSTTGLLMRKVAQAGR